MRNRSLGRSDAVTPSGEVQRPLASVVIGGVVSAMLLTLLLLPVIYASVGQQRTRSPQ